MAALATPSARLGACAEPLPPLPPPLASAGLYGENMAPFPEEVDVFTAPHWRMKQLVGLYCDKVPRARRELPPCPGLGGPAGRFTECAAVSASPFTSWARPPPAPSGGLVPPLLPAADARPRPTPRGRRPRPSVGGGGGRAWAAPRTWKPPSGAWLPGAPHSSEQRGQVFNRTLCSWKLNMIVFAKKLLPSGKIGKYVCKEAAALFP